MRFQRESERQFSDRGEIRGYLALTLVAAALSALLVVSAAGCAPEAVKFTVPGRTTETEARQALAEPVTEISSATRPEAKLLCGQGGECMQIEGKILVARERKPANQRERTLQYWRHKWRGVDKRYDEVAGSRDPHGKVEFQLAAPARGMTVIYDPDTDRVVRVVEYAAAK